MNGPPPPAPADPAAHAAVLREHGPRLLERMEEYLRSLEAGAVSTRRPPSALAGDFASPLPRAGRAPEAVWEEAWARVVGDAIHLAHPMYMGHQVAPPLPHAVLADALASLLNQSVAVWEMSPTGTMVEAEVIRWLGEALGLPASAEGTLVSGGSAANLTGLLAAREARFPGAWRRGLGAVAEGRRVVLLTSPHAHYSVERAAALMGLGADAVVAVPERDGRMDAEALARRLDALDDEGSVALAVCATAGSTATGAFDPLDAVADVCAAHAVWLHVDAAHGASFALSARLRSLLRGIERADSVAWDPHKMMWMPISAGAVLVREGRCLEQAFQQSAPYLFHPQPDEPRSWDAGRLTLQCSRRLDALKVWVSLQVYGTEYLGSLMERTVDVASALHRRLQEAADFEAMHRPEGNILCFRHLPEPVTGWSAPAQDAFQGELRRRYNAGGEGWITATVLDGRTVLRVTIINPATGEEHLDRLLEGLRRIGAELATGG